MKINCINKTKTTTFTGAFLIDLAPIGDFALPVISDCKSKIGEGLIEKAYKCGGRYYRQKVFVGYNSVEDEFCDKDRYEILIATGNDTKIGNKLLTKLAMIDEPIKKTIDKILAKYKLLNNSQIAVEKSDLIDTSGAIKKKYNSVIEVLVSPDFIKNLDNSCFERTGDYYCPFEVPNKNAKFIYYNLLSKTYEFHGIKF